MPPTLWGVKALSKGGHPTVALMDDGTIRCWGAGYQQTPGNLPCLGSCQLALQFVQTTLR